MASQTFATTGFQDMASSKSRKIKDLASNLPSMYAAADERAFQAEQSRIATEGMSLDKDAFKYQKEQDAMAAGASGATMGLTAGMEGYKFLKSDSAPSWLKPKNEGELGLGNLVRGAGAGITGGMAGGGMAKAFGAKKRALKIGAGAAGGALFSALSGAESMLEIGGSSLLGGAVGALF